MSLNSREKSLRGQRDFVKKCRERGVSPIPGLHVEVRRTERLRLEHALRQAAEHSRGRLPVLAHRANRSSWKITMELDDFLLLYQVFSQKPLPDPASPESEPCHGSDPDSDHRP